ncbi:MAG: class I SAM-dependent methyltransferase [Pseudomonadota bacterium]
MTDTGSSAEQRRTAETFDGYQTTYADAVNSAVAFTGVDVDFFTRVKADYIVELVEQEVGPADQQSVLDVGCGIGNFHRLLQPAFANLSGVDVSAACIERAKGEHPEVSYKTYDGGRLPYDDASFDVAFTVCVMHHVPPADWPTFASEMRRVLRPGGLAMVFEHNPLNPLTMRAVNNCPFDEDAVLLRSTKTVALYNDAGFDPVKRRFILSVPAANKPLRRVDQAFSWLPFGAQYYVTARRP